MNSSMDTALYRLVVNVCEASALSIVCQITSQKKAPNEHLQCLITRHKSISCHFNEVHTKPASLAILWNMDALFCSSASGVSYSTNIPRSNTITL